jgi:inosine-uridine nucleoside N-ribohydrolase
MDLGGDSDDLGAIAILYYYHQKGLVNLLATTTPRQVWYAGAMSAINTYYGYPDMPMGFNGNKYNNINDSSYGRYLSMNFSNPVIDNMEFENSVKVIRKALAEAEDKSVTFCVTGTYTNLYNLLLSSADEYSDLNGYDLVKKKVKWIVGMGCQYPEGREANIYNDVVAAKYVNQNWPTPILYSTWEVGNPVLTASRETLDRMDENNPIRVGYEEHFRNLKYGIPRPSWDPITAYFACAGALTIATVSRWRFFTTLPPLQHR